MRRVKIFWCLTLQPVSYTHLDESAVTLNASFVDDLGADSLDIVELIMGLETEFDIEIPDEEAEKIRTVGDAVNYIKAVSYTHLDVYKRQVRVSAAEFEKEVEDTEDEIRRYLSSPR